MYTVPLDPLNLDCLGPAPLLQPNTCWILVAPPSGAHASRVMSFRNGDHIDCDMEVRGPRQLTFLVAKAIEGMLLWLAEKESRSMRISTINIAQVGTRAYRTLWSRDARSPMNVTTLLNNAYTSPTLTGKWDEGADWKRYQRATTSPDTEVSPPGRGGVFLSAAEEVERAAAEAQRREAAEPDDLSIRVSSGIEPI